MSKLTGKVALVTGAGQGVGQGIAFALAKNGAAVAVTGRTLSICSDEMRYINGQSIAVDGGQAFMG